VAASWIGIVRFSVWSSSSAVATLDEDGFACGTWGSRWWGEAMRGRSVWRTPWPGFRSGVWWKKVIALFGYLLIGLFVLGFLSNGSLGLLSIAAVGLGLGFLMSDLRGIRSHSPILGSTNLSTAAIGWVVVAILSVTTVLVAAGYDASNSQASPSAGRTAAPTAASARTTISPASVPTSVPIPLSTGRAVAAPTLPPVQSGAQTPVAAVAPPPSISLPPVPTFTLAPIATSTFAPLPTFTLPPFPTLTFAPLPTQPPVTPVPTPAPAPVAPVPNLCGAPANPWGYNFCSGATISAPPASFCNYFSCIANFWNGRGSVMQCSDLMFSLSGGIRGSCSYHGGNYRYLRAP